jgi:hypothetical protein
VRTSATLRGHHHQLQVRVPWPPPAAMDARGEDLTGAGRSRMRGRRREEVGRSGWRGGSRGVGSLVRSAAADGEEGRVPWPPPAAMDARGEDFGSLVVAPEGDADPPCGRLRGQRGPVAPPHLDNYKLAHTSM